MKANTKKALSGVSLAVAAATMGGCAWLSDGQSTSSAVSSALAKTDLVHCYGVNKCNGHNDCKTANHACAGNATCKGSGFITMPSKACKDAGGKIQDAWVGSINKADLVQCHGVNICKGHNDCKTANHACAGNATCKGSGWIHTPQKACGDMGGTVKS